MMRRMAVLISALFAVNAFAATLTPQTGFSMQANAGFSLALCDDVVFLHHSKPDVLIVHGVTVPQGAWVLTCPRTNATWHLIFTGVCPTAKRVTLSTGNYALTC